MVSIKNLKELSFLIYGLGETGKSVIKFFERNNIKKYQIWDVIINHIKEKKH